MNLIACIDDQNGMMFNHRRQSRDRLLIADALQLCAGRRLWMAPYSASLFSGCADQIHVDPDYLLCAPQGDFCFAEGAPLLPYLQRIESIWLYKWNRVYPADVYLDLVPEQCGFFCTEQKDFTGSSHSRITRECYIRSN